MYNQQTMMSQYIAMSPEVAERYLEAPLDAASRRLVEVLAAGTPVVTTGNGTSFHLALLAARYIQAYAGVEARAVPSFDLAWYSPELTAGKTLIAVSHSGATKATLDAIEAGRRFGPFVVGLSHSLDTKLAKASDLALALPGGREKALPKTMTFTTGAVQFLRLAAEAGRLRGRPSEPLGPAAAVREALARALETNRTVVDEAAHAWKDYETFTFFGGGPAWVTAVEAALKMRENNYTVSEGYEVEEIAHGRTAPFQARRPVVGIILRGPSRERANDILATARYCGAPTMAVVEEGAEGGESDHADFRLTVPRMPSEAAAAIAAVVPLQWFSHQYSVVNDINPDSIRLDDPVHAYAENAWVFPPGTH